MTVRLAAFISGRGTNMEAVLKAIEDRRLNARMDLVVSSREDAPGLLIARERGIETVVFNRADFAALNEADEFLLEALRSRKIQLILLAGYLKKIPAPVIRAYPDRIVNIHPALLPKYGGKGMYGIHVHEAVIAAGETETGVTVHYVNEEYDKGRIIAQERVPVLPGDSPESLAARVLQVEHTLYPQVLATVLSQLKLDG